MQIDAALDLAEAVRDAVELGGAGGNTLVPYDPDKHRELLEKAARIQVGTYGSVVMATVARMAEHGVAVRLDVDGDHVMDAIKAARKTTMI